MENTYIQPSGLKPFIGITIAIIALIAVFLIMLRADTYMKYQAIYDCGRISTYQQDLGNGTKVSYPVQDIYNSCLQKKGL